MKTVGGRHYVHRSAVRQLGSDVQLHIRAALKLAKERGCLEPDVISVRAGPDPMPIGLAWCDDFDGEPEPAIVQSAQFRGGGDIVIRVSGQNPQIFHGKELLVGEGYTGFDVAVAMARREAYMASRPDPLRMGRRDWWRDWCIEHGIAL